MFLMFSRELVSREQRAELLFCMEVVGHRNVLQKRILRPAVFDEGTRSMLVKAKERSWFQVQVLKVNMCLMPEVQY